MIHQQRHPQFVEDCWACRIGTVGIAAAAMPTRREQTNTMNDSWAKQMRDDAAYVRLYKDGLNPPRTAGCHELEQCDDRRIIEGTPELWDQRHEILADLSDTPQTKVEAT